MKSILFSAAVAMAALTTSAQAAVITFNDAAFGEHPGLVEYTEAGFKHSVQTGGLFVGVGNPGAGMEGSVTYDGGVLEIVALDNSLFTFKGLDFSAYGPEGDAQFLLVTGLLQDAEVGYDFFLLDNSSAEYNWNWFSAANLAGVNIDTLTISLGAGAGPKPYWTAVDNVTLGASAVPEPATWALMITGFGLAGVALRRRRGTAIAA